LPLTVCPTRLSAKGAQTASGRAIQLPGEKAMRGPEDYKWDCLDFSQLAALTSISAPPVPTTYLVDAEGRVRMRFRGPMNDGGWAAADAIEALMAEMRRKAMRPQVEPTAPQPSAASPTP
jgi:hypothetical protein